VSVSISRDRSSVAVFRVALVCSRFNGAVTNGGSLKERSTSCATPAVDRSDIAVGWVSWRLRGPLMALWPSPTATGRSTR